MARIKSRNQAKKLCRYYTEYADGSYSYQTKRNNEYHLIKDGKDLLEGLEATNFITYRNGDHKYTVFKYGWHILTGGYYQLLRDGRNLLEGLTRVTDCHSYPNGDYTYQTQGCWHLIRNGVDLFEGLEVSDYIIYTDNDYSFKYREKIVNNGVASLKSQWLDIDAKTKQSTIFNRKEKELLKCEYLM
jgi:hypothetical protein